MRRLLIVVPVFLLMFVIVRSGLLDTAYDRFTFNNLSWFDNTALVEHLRTVITNRGLSTLPRQCLVFVVNGDASVNTPDIDVLGRHGNNCPGTTPSADLLFKIRVNRAERVIQTDAGSSGVFHTLSP
ncbi:hypothetical protein GS501_06340 [Saccharibacter sp. 17.LH.SD]|nr:hypothetical protein [Saccharibacter sp. 17.LH.SD]